MNTKGTERKLPRILTMAALACFALPFLTVTCYGETTVSGVQAATGIDIYPDDSRGEKELVREEPPNGFAFVALAAAAVAAALSFGSVRSRRATLWAAAFGVIALEGLFVYALYRSWGGAWPRIGFTGALVLLVGAAWAGVERVPRWVAWTTPALGASMIPATLMSVDALRAYSWVYLPVYVAGIVALALTMGAIRAAVRPADVVPAGSAWRPGTLRIVVAGIVGAACLAAAAVASAFLMGVVLGAQAAPDDVGSSYAVAIVVLAMMVAASVVAWIAGRAIVHGGRRRTAFAPLRTEVGA
jgi:hypothetical protein